MKLSEFVKNLPDYIWVFEDNELRWYNIHWSDTPNEPNFYNSDNDYMDCWCGWPEFLEDCSHLYLSVEDFKADNRFYLELDEESV